MLTNVEGMLPKIRGKFGLLNPVGFGMIRKSLSPATFRNHPGVSATRNGVSSKPVSVPDWFYGSLILCKNLLKLVGGLYIRLDFPHRTGDDRSSFLFSCLHHQHSYYNESKYQDHSDHNR